MKCTVESPPTAGIDRCQRAALVEHVVSLPSACWRTARARARAAPTAQEANQRPPSLSNYSMYPPAQPNGSGADPRIPPLDEIHHASPRIIGTPMSSTSSPSKTSNVNKLRMQEGTPSGPEKPQRQYSYHEESQQIANERNTKLSTTSRVRFQDIDNEVC